MAVVGPSGAGKDTLTSRAARHASLNPRIRFVWRVVTRDALTESEDHDSLDQAAFARAQAKGTFCLTWAAHGLCYALPRSVETDLGEGRIVVANLSRGSLGAASDVFGAVHIVEVTAHPDILFARISARGRETKEQIQDRLRRETTMTPPSRTAGDVRIDDSGDVETATDFFVRHLNELARSF